MRLVVISFEAIELELDDAAAFDNDDVDERTFDKSLFETVMSRLRFELEFVRAPFVLLVVIVDVVIDELESSLCTRFMIMSSF